MAESNVGAPVRRSRFIDAQRVVPVMAVVLLLIALLAVVDLWLARIAADHKSHVGQEFFRRAVAAARAGDKSDEVLELFRSAYNHEPLNAEYHLAFAIGLRVNGRIAESKAAITNLLNRVPTNGPANAELARILAAEGAWEDASWYYHRALYGEWGKNADLRPLRFELADLLARAGAREQLLAELLMLEATGAGTTEGEHLARLWLASHDWDRAEKQFRTLLSSKPDDSSLLLGLAEAQFGAGRYRTAEATYRRLLATGKFGEREQERLAVAAQITDLDPTVRRLGATEKHRRTHELASRLVTALQTCSPSDTRLLAASAQLQRHKGVRDQLARSEEDLRLFEELWDERNQLCPKGAAVPKSVELLAAQVLR